MAKPSYKYASKRFKSYWKEKQQEIADELEQSRNRESVLIDSIQAATQKNEYLQFEISDLEEANRIKDGIIWRKEQEIRSYNDTSYINNARVIARFDRKYWEERKGEQDQEDNNPQ
jgi:hypothetical protein